jgi:hypothetical protein
MVDSGNTFEREIRPRNHVPSPKFYLSGGRGELQARRSGKKLVHGGESR